MQSRASFGLLLISRLYERVRCSYFEGDGETVLSLVFKLTRDTKQDMHLYVVFSLFFVLFFFFFSINDLSVIYVNDLIIRSIDFS